MVAAQDVKRQLFIMAGSKATNMLQQWDLPALPGNPPTLIPEPTVAQLDTLDAKEDKIFLKADPTKSVTHARVMAAIINPVIGRGVRWEPILRKPVGTFAAGGTGVHRTGCASAAEVAVDPETGEVELLNWVSVLDCGRVIDRNSTEGQMYSGMQNDYNIAMLFEDVVDPLTGILLGYNHIHDRLSTTMDWPVDKNQIVMLETIDANGPYGCHGIGEPAIGKQASIINAVNNAIGKWVVTTPLTPRTILRALGKA